MARQATAQGRLIQGVASLLAILLLGFGAQEVFGQAPEPRVIVLGVDGLDFALTQRWIEEGELPALASLRSEGGFQPLRSTNPAQSPTAWASLVTGENPGETGIFGFLRRGFRGDKVIPELALVERSSREVVPAWMPPTLVVIGVVLAWVFWRWRRYRPRTATILLIGLALTAGGVAFVVDQLPKRVPVPKPLMGGVPFWKQLDEAGIKACSLFAPMAFPAPNLDHGCLACGFGVPDALATHGSTVRWSTDAPPGGAVSQMGSKHLPIDQDADGSLAPLHLLGPLNPRNGERLKKVIPIERTAAGVQLDFGGRVVRLDRGGAFSPFVEVQLPFSRVIDPLHALVRYRMLNEAEAITLYQEPLQLDPRHQVPWARTTSPQSYGADLVSRYGPYETVGWASATNPLQDGLIDEDTFFRDIEGIDERREKMLLGEMKRDDWRLFFGVVYTPDRVQHMFFSDLDPEHPGHDAEAAAKRGPVILESYRRIDALVARIQSEVLRPGDTLLVVSDHGFAPFRRAVNLNRWLAEQGWFAARPDGDRNLSTDLEGDALRHVDWSKTRAYALGLGRIWVSIKGREPKGIVPPEEADALIEEIRARLLELQDKGASVVHSVRRPHEIYSGSRIDESADLIVGFKPGWRISWNACLGGSDEPVLFDNRSRWSGDHCSVDPEFVPGVFLSNRPLRTDGLTTLDLVPTLRALLGLQGVEGADGRSALKP